MHACVALAALFLPLCQSFPSYGFNVPNGARVACPPAASGMDTATCEVGDADLGEPASWCSGVAHHTCTGGSLPLNPFGVALKAAEFIWTKALCDADSDGDGLTNGDELGDPCCTWKRGDAPSPHMRSFRATHPGFPTPSTEYTRPKCGSTGLKSPREAVARSAFNPGEIRKSMEWRVRNYTLAHRETVYVDVIFNFDDEAEDDYHIVYADAIVNQSRYLHHFVVQGCTERIDPQFEGIPLQTISAGMKKGGFRRKILTNCQEQIGGFWAPGDRPMWDIPTNTGIRIGKGSGIRAFSVNIHYTDGNTAPRDSVRPQDGIKLFYTPNLRPKTHVITPLVRIVGLSTLPSVMEDNMDALGMSFLRVPAGAKRWYLTRRCEVKNRCKDSSPEELKAMSHNIVGSCAIFKMLGYCSGLVKIFCPETCGQAGACTGGDKPLRAMDTFFHAHLLGTEMYQSVTKADTGEMIDLGSMRHWSYEDETVVPIDGKGVLLEAGDVLTSTCVYNTESTSKPTDFGLSTYEEMCLNTLGVEMDTEDKHFGFAFNCEGHLWSGELGDTQSALNIHATETLLSKTSDCWSALGNGLDCTHQKQQLIQGPSPEAQVGTASAADRRRIGVAAAFAGALACFYHFSNTE